MVDARFPSLVKKFWQKGNIFYYVKLTVLVAYNFS
jgi:hypothetical protein